MEQSYRKGVGLILLSPAQKKVLVGRRTDDLKLAPSWQFPQGGIDPDEDVELALRREANEEIGTDNFRIICSSPAWLTYDFPEEIARMGPYKGQTMKWFLCEFNGLDSEINIDTEKPEFGEWKWMQFADCHKHAVEFKRAVYVQLISLFQDEVAHSIAKYDCELSK
jgi:putative (di)nucleoside polyphosphate hydrolase